MKTIAGNRTRSMNRIIPTVGQGLQASQFSLAEAPVVARRCSGPGCLDVAEGGLLEAPRVGGGGFAAEGGGACSTRKDAARARNASYACLALGSARAE